MTMPCATMACIEFGDDPVGRAAYICSQHQTIGQGGAFLVENGVATFTRKPDDGPKWDAAWSACRKVWKAWLDSAAAREKAAAEKLEQQDLDFINSVAGTLR